MEPRFGRDFSQVRLHTDTQAATSAALIRARAWTLGNDIVMGRDEFSPSSSKGRQLLAHELAHVVQQGGKRSAIQRAPLKTRQEISDRVEDIYYGQCFADNFHMLRFGMFSAYYCPYERVLHIGVPIRFDFQDSVAEKTSLAPNPNPSQPPTIVNTSEMKRWNSDEVSLWKTRFINTVERTWSTGNTGHILHCHEAGLEGLNASVEVKVHEIKEDEPSTQPTYFSVSVYRGDSPRTDYVDKGRAMLAYDDAPHVYAHEFGHMLGFDDEYEDPRHIKTEATHSDMVRAEFGYGVPRLDPTREDRFKKSLMSSGEQVLPEHGVIFLEVIRQLTGLPNWHLK